jgi:replication factor C subunit 3/5
MSLWLDKHRPANLDKLTLHEGLNARLRKVANSPQFPHLLFYGPPGSGKRTRIMCVLREMFGASVEKLKVEHREFKLDGVSKPVELTVVCSNHHVELNPSDAGTKDSKIVQEVIKGIAENHAITSSQRTFKVVVLNEVDRLSTSAQAALRRTMEKYSAGCRLILSCNSACRVIEPVRSRCMPVRVPAPSETEIEQVLQSVCKAERVQLPPEFAHKIAVQSERNLRRALLMLEASKVQAGPAGIRPDQPVARADWQTFIEQLAADVVARQSPDQLLACRSKFYELLTNCIPPEVILKQLSVELLAKTDQALVQAVCREAAFYEHRIRKGQKPIFHLEAFAAKYMTLHSQWTLSMTQGM